MQPDRYEVSREGRHWMSGVIEKRGTKLGMPNWGGFLFGGIFVGIGVWIILIGAHVFYVNPAKVHAPFWVLTVFGVSFALAGLMVWGMTWNQFRAERARRAAAREHGNEPALLDYAWHPDGFEISEWAGAAKGFGWAIGLTIFLATFNWWAFGTVSPWMVKMIVGIFDLITIWVWVQAALQLLRAFKFGRSRIDFTPFPYRLSEPVVVRWKPDRGIKRIDRGTFTLRCVEEWTEVSGSGNDRNSHIVHEEVWSATWTIEQPRELSENDPVQVSYDLPKEALGTQLSADRPVFWELEVKLELPGVDFKESYLVPVYG